MKLPNSDKAIIPKEKLTDYLLSETHAGGRSKAKFFRSLGFNETNISLLEKHLLNLAVAQDVKVTSESIHGVKYVIEGDIHTPSRKVARIRTIWIMEPGQHTPRFVTAYPV